MNITSQTRRELMAKRDQALAARDLPRFQRLTNDLAKLPIKGVPALTQKDIARYTGKK